MSTVTDENWFVATISASVALCLVLIGYLLYFTVLEEHIDKIFGEFML